jgi:hypothetical protein
MRVLGELRDISLTRRFARRFLPLAGEVKSLSSLRAGEVSFPFSCKRER